MRGPPVVLTNTLGRPVTNIISERGAVPMTVVNTLGEPVTLVNSGGEPVTLFNANGTLWDFPFSLFSNNEQGAWYDPSDFSTLFQDAAGTTPVTAVEQPVGLMLDRSGRGNNATAPNDASRPILRARYNLLTRTEEFDNAGWAKLTSAISGTFAAPNDTTTAQKLAGTVGSTNIRLQQALSLTASTTYIYSIFAKAAEYTTLRVGRIDTNVNTFTHDFDLSAGSASGGGVITALANGWYRCSGTIVCNTTASTGVVFTAQVGVTANGTDGLLLWGAQLLTSADATATGNAYQRIAAATDYDTSNPVWRPYLAFDGSDDSLSTSAIDFSGTDEMTVFAGLTKLSDVASAVVAEFTASVASENGSFQITAPASAGADSYSFRSKGTTLRSAIPTGYAAPVTNVLTGIGDIGGDVATLRVNGTQAATDTGDQGTGNYANAALFIGRRNNTSSPFNGRLYGLTVLGRTATAAELSAMEAWVNGKTGVNLP